MMHIVRLIAGVIVGYAVFVVSAVLLFRVGGIDAHAEPSIGILVLVIGWGIFFSFIGGLLAQWIAGTHRLIVNYLLALLMAGFAAFSFFKSEGNHYTRVAAIFLFAPASVLGGLLRPKRRAK